MTEDQLSLKHFRGTARLFPLPNLVLFPSVIQPLHIFEPRYREMMADALDDDRLLALPIEVKQELLEEQDVTRRAQRLLEQLQEQEPPTLPKSADRRFPPEFSQN